MAATCAGKARPQPKLRPVNPNRALPAYRGIRRQLNRRDASFRGCSSHLRTTNFVPFCIHFVTVRLRKTDTLPSCNASTSIPTLKLPLRPKIPVDTPKPLVWDSTLDMRSSFPPRDLNAVDLRGPELYLNRELSLLAFQQRVLGEAEDEKNPRLERLKFLAILGSNLDEFFMVRVAGLLAQMDSGAGDAGLDGMSPRAQLVAIRREVMRLMKEAYHCLQASG